MIVALPIAMMRPMLGSYVVNVTTTATKGVDAVRLINTGLLPAQFHARVAPSRVAEPRVTARNACAPSLRSMRSV